MAEEQGWNAEVTLEVTVRVKAKPDPKLFEGWDGRTPGEAAKLAVFLGGISDMSRVDGLADLIGEADIVDVYVEQVRGG